MTEYPALSPSLAEQLARVPRSRGQGLEYAPCRVTLADGRVLDRVYVQEATEYLRLWGDDPNRPFLALDEVVAIQESPVRLPPELAERIYRAGESGMGYHIFTVVLRDGRRFAVVTGDAVDFPAWPSDVLPGDVVEVLPHKGREQPEPFGGADYLWCLYRS